MSAMTRPMLSVSEPTLYVAFELGKKDWKLALTSGFGIQPWLRTVASRDWPAVERVMAQGADAGSDAAGESTAGLAGDVGDDAAGAAARRLVDDRAGLGRGGAAGRSAGAAGPRGAAPRRRGGADRRA